MRGVRTFCISCERQREKSPVRSKTRPGFFLTFWTEKNLFGFFVEPVEVLLDEIHDLFEFLHVVLIDVHQGLMRFQHGGGAGDAPVRRDGVGIWG